MYFQLSYCLSFIQRLHQVVKRDAELKLQKISQHYEEKCQELNDRSVMTYPIQQKRQLKVQDEKRMKNIEKVLEIMKVCLYQHDILFFQSYVTRLQVFAGILVLDITITLWYLMKFHLNSSFLMTEYMKTTTATGSDEHWELCVLQLRMSHQKYNGIMPYNQTTVVQVPKPPPYTSQLNLKKRQQQQQRREQQAQVWSRLNKLIIQFIYFLAWWHRVNCGMAPEEFVEAYAFWQWS